LIENLEDFCQTDEKMFEEIFSRNQIQNEEDQTENTGIFIFTIYCRMKVCLSEEQGFCFPNLDVFDDEESKLEFQDIKETDELEDFSKSITFEVNFQWILLKFLERWEGRHNGLKFN